MGALAQVSGGLVGLVFVALTFNAKALGVGGDPMLGALARQTFADFLLLLLVSLVMLTPHTAAANVGLIFLAFSVVDTLRILRNLLRLRRHLRGSAGNWEITRRFLLSALAHLLLAGVGIGLLSHADPGLSGSLLFSGVMLLLLSGCRSAWLLVMQDLNRTDNRP